MSWTNFSDMERIQYLTYNTGRIKGYETLKYDYLLAIESLNCSSGITQASETIFVLDK